MTSATKLLAVTTALSALPALGWAALYPNVVDNSFDRLMSDLVIPPTATTQGMWGPVTPWPLVGLHLSVLPTGQILSYGGTGLNGGMQDGRVLDVWDPALGLTTAAHTQLGDPAGVDSFCSSSAVLANGQVLISGGSSYASNDSAQASTTLSPTGLTTAVSGSLNAPRWYGTMTTLADGRQMESGGAVAYATTAYADPASAIASNTVSMTPEVFTLWLKTRDDNVANWVQVPGKAKRVAIVDANSLFTIGLDNNVYHVVGAQTTMVGTQAQAITASQDGSVAIVSNQDGSIWKKNQPGVDSDGGWTQQPGIGNELAWKNGSNAWLIGVAGGLLSK